MADDEYRVSVGRYTAPDAATLNRYLTHLGSRLVFLIDWNKARKQLSRFLSKDDAVAVLRWAADANVGHRAFLEAGEATLRSVLERSTHPQLKFGLQLEEIIGAEAARAFFKSVLRIASDGLRAGRTRQLIADEIEAELLFRLGLLAAVVSVLKKTALDERIAFALALVSSAVIFALAHHVGQYGEPLTAHAVAFRTVAGCVFGLVFWYRSLAHAVYAHVLYDLLVAFA